NEAANSEQYFFLFLFIIGLNWQESIFIFVGFPRRSAGLKRPCKSVRDTFLPVEPYYFFIDS
ncbi:MAG: hypothetical protein LBF28_02265, partial [Rickettsiales bacterium]|nr:hypothetical protein [Rickettsiales bacterium]